MQSNEILRELKAGDMYASTSASSLLINYKDAPCGAGKTYGTIKWVFKSVKFGKNILIVSPTCELVDQSYQMAQKMVEDNPNKWKNIEIFKFHGKDGDSDSPVVRLEKFMRDRDTGCLVFATHAAFFRLVCWFKGRWKVIVDEAPSLDGFFNMHIPSSHRLITDMVDVEDYNARLYEVVPVDTAGLEGYSQNRMKDDVWSHFSNIATAILSPHFRVFVDKEAWHRHLKEDTEKGKWPLTMVSLLEPSVFDGWEEVVMLGAFLKDSGIFKYWSNKHNVQWKEQKGIKLRYDEHVGSERMEMMCFYDNSESGKVWSQTLGRKVADGDAIEIKYLILKRARDLMGDKELFAVLCNKQDEGMVKVLLDGSNYVILPQYSYGLNMYDHIDNFVSIGAFHVSPTHRRMLGEWDLTPEDVFMSVHLQTLYQALCRTSIRDPNSDRKIKVFLPDLKTAEILNGYFKQAKIGLVGDDLEVRYSNPKKRWESDAQRRANERARQALLEVAGQEAHTRADAFYLHMNGCDPNFCPDSLNIQRKPGQKGGSPMDWIDVVDGQGSYLMGSLYLNKYKKNNTSVVCVADEAEAISWLEYMWQDSYAEEKEQNILISPSLFKSDTGRSRDNVDFANALFLDVDGGDLHESGLAKIFPDIKFITHNTWSSKDRTKFRAWFPVSRPVMVGEYQHLMKEIITRIESAEYLSPKAKKVALARNYKSKDKPCHGIDLSKQAPENLMFLPCQAGIENGVSFFEKYIDGRTTLDVDLWIQNMPVREPEKREEYSQTIVVAPDPKQSGASQKLQKLRQNLLAQQNDPLVKLKQAEDDIRTAPSGTGHSEALTRYKWMYHLVKDGKLKQGQVESALDSAFMSRGGDIAKRRVELQQIKKSAWEYAK